MATTILTRPQGNNVGVPGTIVTGVSIDPNNAVVVDSVLATSNVAVKWIYTLMDPLTNSVLSGEVLAIVRNGTSPSHNRYAIIGDLIPHTVNVIVTLLGELALEITNLSANTLTSNIVRLQVLS